MNPSCNLAQGLLLFRFRLKSAAQSWGFDTVFESWEVRSYSIERTLSSQLRCLAAAAHVVGRHEDPYTKARHPLPREHMPLDQNNIEQAIVKGGFIRGEANAKRVQFTSQSNEKVIYFIPGVGLPRHARLVVHPDLRLTTLTSLEGVTASEKGLHHGSTLSDFPKRLHTGAKEIHYGQALNVASLASISSFAEAFHKL